MKYFFYGADTPPVKPIDPLFDAVRDQRHLYELLSEIWCEYTCAPRLRPEWAPDNRTLGQCSITAFLVQDIFGGEVYGIALPSGGYHCYNAIGDVTFDLTSEQFNGEKLCFERIHPQSRKAHFADPEKHARYLYLREQLLSKLRDLQ